MLYIHSLPLQPYITFTRNDSDIWNQWFSHLTSHKVHIILIWNFAGFQQQILYPKLSIRFIFIEILCNQFTLSQILTMKYYRIKLTYMLIQATVVGVSRLQLLPLGHNSIIAHVMLTLWPTYPSGRQRVAGRGGFLVTFVLLGCHNR